MLAVFISSYVLSCLYHSDEYMNNKFVSPAIFRGFFGLDFSF